MTERGASDEEVREEREEPALERDDIKDLTPEEPSGDDIRGGAARAPTTSYGPG